jgi:uncharacterized protein YceK
MIAVAVFMGAILATSCSSPSDVPQPSEAVATTTPAPVGCADVVEATIGSSGDTYRVAATILSADTGWEKYADAWEVRSPDGEVLGTRVLAHPHVDEQPFTRSLDGVVIPERVATVEIVARDSVAGFCGQTAAIPVPGR